MRVRRRIWTKRRVATTAAIAVLAAAAVAYAAYQHRPPRSDSYFFSTDDLEVRRLGRVIERRMADGVSEGILAGLEGRLDEYGSEIVMSVKDGWVTLRGRGQDKQLGTFDDCVMLLPRRLSR